MSERRYDEGEVKRIFERATRRAPSPRPDPGGAGSGSSGSSSGLTLEELQQIGEEVGISRELVARSAAALEAGGETGKVTRRALGVPLAVSMVTPLPRPLTDTEWERLVVDLREIFDAPGRIRTEGRFRRWRNGNLHAMLEPDSDGERFRIRTRRGGGEFPVLMGAGLLSFAVVVSVLSLLTGVPLAEVVREGGVIALVGSISFGFGAFTLRSWARTRLDQMEAISERVAQMASAPDPDAGEEATPEPGTDRLPPPPPTG